jgi:hypothetical protein
MKKCSVSIVLSIFAALVAALFISSCTSVPEEYKHVVIAKESGAKFLNKEPLKAGRYYEWTGAVDRRGYATGPGTRTEYYADGKKTVEATGIFKNGFHIGSVEFNVYDSDGVLGAHVVGNYDSRGQAHGREEWNYYGLASLGLGIKREIYHIEHGFRHGNHTIFWGSNDGGHRVNVYSRGVVTDSYDVAGDGTVTREYAWERKKQLRESAQAFRAQVAREEAARREARSNAFFSGLAQGLAEIATTSNSYSSGSYPSSSNSTSRYSSSSSSSQAQNKISPASGSGRNPGREVWLTSEKAKPSVTYQVQEKKPPVKIPPRTYTPRTTQSPQYQGPGTPSISK